MKHELINGKSDYLKFKNTEDTTKDRDSTGSLFSAKYSFYKKILTDNIVDCIIKIFHLNDENIWLRILKLFYVMFKNKKLRSITTPYSKYLGLV